MAAKSFQYMVERVEGLGYRVVRTGRKTVVVYPETQECHVPEGDDRQWVFLLAQAVAAIERLDDLRRCFYIELPVVEDPGPAPGALRFIQAANVLHKDMLDVAVILTEEALRDDKRSVRSALAKIVEMIRKGESPKDIARFAGKRLGLPEDHALEVLKRYQQLFPPDPGPPGDVIERWWYECLKTSRPEGIDTGQISICPEGDEIHIIEIVEGLVTRYPGTNGARPKRPQNDAGR